MQKAIEYAESKLGIKMPQIGSRFSSEETSAPSDFEMVNQKPADLKDGPILHCRIGTPIANMILVAASYANFNVQQSQIDNGDAPTRLQIDEKTSISTPLAIIHYISQKNKNPNLYGKEMAQVLQWINLSLSDAQSASLNWVLNNKQDSGRNLLKMLEDYLKTRTYLAGERISMADISMSMALMPLYQFSLDEKSRQSFANTSRWFNTCINQPNFLNVLGNVKLCVDPVKSEKDSKKGKK